MTTENTEGSGTTAEPSVFTDAESKAIAAIAVAIMMSRSSVPATDLHKHFIGLLEGFKAAREERDALTAHSDRALGRIADLEGAVRRAADYLTSAADIIADGPDHDEEDENDAREFIEELRALAPTREATRDE